MTSLPWLPVIESLPAPPSTVSFTTPAGSVEAEIVSAPPSPLTTSVSLAASVVVICTSAGSPTTDADVPLPRTLIASAALLPLTTTTSAAASPVAPPLVPASR